MNKRSQHIMNMAGACLGIAHHPDYQPVWLEHPALVQALAQAEQAYASATAKAALAAASAGGAAAAKAAAEADLENKAFLLARALCYHFKQSGDFDRLGRVDLSRTDLRQLRKRELVNKTMAIRDLAHSALDEPQAASRWVTAQAVDELSAAIDTYNTLLNLPRTQLVNQGTWLMQSDAEARELAVRFRDITDLVVQCGRTARGAGFVEAWHRARRIVNSRGPSPSTATPATKAKTTAAIATAPPPTVAPDPAAPTPCSLTEATGRSAAASPPDKPGTDASDIVVAGTNGVGTTGMGDRQPGRRPWIGASWKLPTQAKLLLWNGFEKWKAKPMDR